MPHRKPMIQGTKPNGPTQEAVRDKRAGVLDAAYAKHPERFVRKPPEPPKIPEISWINRPDQPEENAH